MRGGNLGVGRGLYWERGDARFCGAIPLKLALGLVGLLSISPAFAGPYERGAAGYALERPFVYSRNGAPGPVTRPLASGNDCGVDRPVPVWGPHNEMLGYACEQRPLNR